MDFIPTCTSYYPLTLPMTNYQLGLFWSQMTKTILNWLSKTVQGRIIQNEDILEPFIKGLSHISFHRPAQFSIITAVCLFPYKENHGCLQLGCCTCHSFNNGVLVLNSKLLGEVLIDLINESCAWVDKELCPSLGRQFLNYTSGTKSHVRHMNGEKFLQKRYAGHIIPQMFPTLKKSNSLLEKNAY